MEKVPWKDKWRRWNVKRRCRNVERNRCHGNYKENAVESFKEKVPWEDKKVMDQKNIDCNETDKMDGVAVCKAKCSGVPWKVARRGCRGKS
jgi:hypothetical protein